MTNNDLTTTQENNVQQLIEAGNQMSIVNAAVMDAEEALKMIGRIEAADFMATVAEKMIAETAIALKQGKKYKGLPFIDENKNRRQVATFEEFCEHKLGKSRRRVDELINNYNQLGPNLYEQAERIGFRQRDYNALKTLPADDRQIIAQAIEAEDLDKALDLMQQLAAKHQREKEATAKELKALTNSLDDKDLIIKSKTELLNKTSDKLVLLEAAKRQEITEVAMPGEYQLMRLQEYSRELTVKITATLNSEIAKLYKEFEGQPPKHIELAARQAVGLIITAAYGVAENMGFEPVLEPEQADDEPGRADAKEFEAYLATQNAGLIAESHPAAPENEDFEDFFEDAPAAAKSKKNADKPLIEYSDEDWKRLESSEA